MEHSIAAGKFKAECLKLIDDVSSTHIELTITKRGKPLVKLVPVPENSFKQRYGCMGGTAEIHFGTDKDEDASAQTTVDDFDDEMEVPEIESDDSNTDDMFAPVLPDSSFLENKLPKLDWDFNKPFDDKNNKDFSSDLPPLPDFDNDLDISDIFVDDDKPEYLASRVPAYAGANSANDYNKSYDYHNYQKAPLGIDVIDDIPEPPQDLGVSRADAFKKAFKIKWDDTKVATLKNIEEDDGYY